MFKLAELRKQLGDLKAKGLKIVDKMEAAADEPALTAAQAEYDALTAQIGDVTAQIERAEKLAEARRAMAATSPALSVAVNDPNPATTGGFKDVAEFAMAVRATTPQVGGGLDPRLMAAAPTSSNTHLGGASSGEGYMVPPEFRDAIFEVMTEASFLRGLVDQEPTEKREIKSIADETTPWGATGVQAYWRGEGDQMSTSKLVTDPRTLVLHELYAFAQATEEMLEDAPRLANRLTMAAGRALAWKADYSMVWGTGAGQPLGFMNAGALVTQAKTSGQAADTITAVNVQNMRSRLLKLQGSRPIWLANSDALPALAGMTVGDTPIFLPPTGLQDDRLGTLLGLPVIETELAKTLGDLGDLLLIQPKGYHAAFRTSGPQFAESMHLLFDYNARAFRWTFRFGGQPHLSAPVSPAHGTNTKSHFVALAERA